MRSPGTVNMDASPGARQSRDSEMLQKTQSEIKSPEMTYNYLNSRPFSITPKLTSDEGFMQMQQNNADQAGIVVRIDSELGGFTSEEDEYEVVHKDEAIHNNTREASDSDNDSHS